MTVPTRPERTRGCLLGGALGDALGAEVEFDGWADIRRRYGADGIASPTPPARFTDDTQMTLFTAEGLLQGAAGNGVTAESVWEAYLRWLHTQGDPLDDRLRVGWLLDEPALFGQRAPGATCLAALRGGRPGGIPQERRPPRDDGVGVVINDGKGCGGVMRAAPAGLISADLATAFRHGSEVAALTHTHPSGYLAAGMLAGVVHALLQQAGLDEAIGLSADELYRWPEHAEVAAAIIGASHAAAAGPLGPERIAAELGAGWVAEEALAIALACALQADDVAGALRLAVNHAGDSDSTGAIAGNLVGALHGEQALPADWLTALDSAAVVGRMADELAAAPIHLH